MSRTILFIAAFWLAVPLWGQSGIMPRRSSSIKIPSQETMEKITEADPELVSREPVSTLSDTISRALLFSPVAVDMLGFDKRMSDTKESFLLRNNTPYRLSRVVLKMIYRTPDGQMIDYRTRMVIVIFCLVRLASVKSRVSTVRKIIIMSILPRLVCLDVRSK